MDKEVLFAKIDALAADIENEQSHFPKTLALTIHYVSGEKESLEVSEGLRVMLLSATHKRCKFFYVQGKLINIDNVIRFEFKKMK